MDWRKLFSPSDAAAAAHTSDVTITYGALYSGGGIPGAVETPATPDGPDPRVSEEVKRRQVALLLRYVMAIRVR
jgi:hypothetical protein